MFLSQIRIAAVCLLVSALALPSARADEDPAAAATEAASSYGKITNGKGVYNLDVAIEIGLDDGAAFDPVSISPDLWWGLADSLDVGVVHSTMNTTGFVGFAEGNSICVTDAVCEDAEIYHNVGLEGRFALTQGGPFAAAVNGGPFVAEFEPFTISAKAGLMAQFTAGRIVFSGAPSVFFGITERSNGNTERLFLPLNVSFLLSPRLVLGVQGGVTGLVDTLDETYQVPVSLGAHFSINPQLGFGAAFSLPAVTTGADELDGIDARTLTIWLSYSGGGEQ
jgi:hypothetical protein